MALLQSLQWSTAVTRAEWIADGLTDFSANAVTAIVPAGFEAYARLLHPAAEATPGGRRLVRWRDVAAWSRRPLEPDAPFHAVALPEDPVGAAPPWSGGGPRHGSLAAADAEALFTVVRRHTRTPDDCWFCVWDGYRWVDAPLGSDAGTGASAGATAVTVDDRPRVELHHRRYVLYRGPVESAIVQVTPGTSFPHTANLWWPEDRAWCVASEVDLAWTYVGGSVALIRALIGDPALEAVEVAPTDPVAVIDPRIVTLVEPAVETLLHDGQASVVTPLGTVDASLQLPRRLGRGSFHYRVRSALGVESDEYVLDVRRRDRRTLHQLIGRHLEDAVIGLVGG